MKTYRMDQRGFTLVEILVVLTLTIIVMGLVLVPLTQSLKITRTAEVMVRAQDNARFAMSRVTEDLSDAMYVYDNHASFVNFEVPNALSQVTKVRVYFSKVDLVLPKMRGYCPLDAGHTPGGAYRGDEASPICPVCGAELDLKPIEPLVQDDKVVRYFVGLRDPMSMYDNGYEKKRSSAVLTEAATDNMFVLYRAEFSPKDPALFPKLDERGNLRGAIYNLNDEDFFCRTELNVYGEPYAAAWRRISRPVSGIEDVDLVTVKYDDNGDPMVSASIRFAPTAVYNDPLTPTTSTDGESPPTTFKASYGNWVLPYKITVESPSASPFIFTTDEGASVVPNERDMWIYKVDASNPASPAVPVFNISNYERTKAASKYGVGVMSPQALADREKAFTVDTARGTVCFAFPNVYEQYCDALNTKVQQQLGNNKIARPLSDVFNSSDVATRGSLLLNCAPTSGPDPRVLPNATVVPGSLRIMAPDATRGTDGMLLRAGLNPQVTYASAPTFVSDPGVNQFALDTSYSRDLNGISAPGTAAVYFGASKSVSGPATILPGGTNNIFVYYEVQNNKKDDILRASYITKSLMTVQIGIRMYDGGTGRVQVATLTNKVRLKNVSP